MTTTTRLPPLDAHSFFHLDSLLRGVRSKWGLHQARDVDHVLADTNRAIEAQIGERDAVVLGAWAAPLIFDTPYQTYYVKPKAFNMSREALESMNVTHLLVRNRNDWTYRFIQKTFPDIAHHAKTVKTYDLWRGFSVDLRPIDTPLAQLTIVKTAETKLRSDSTDQRKQPVPYVSP
ncbi:MAG: hypothetical protein WCE62_00640 [Polyangiales bacterium]